MTFVIDTVGEITLPDGTTTLGVILTSDDRNDIRAAARHWAGRVELVPVANEQAATKKSTTAEVQGNIVAALAALGKATQPADVAGAIVSGAIPHVRVTE